MDRLSPQPRAALGTVAWLLLVERSLAVLGMTGKRCWEHRDPAHDHAWQESEYASNFLRSAFSLAPVQLLE
ncbi:MAG: hypothetical protein ACR2OE_18200 [Thermomicrobiales bacterium]